MKKRFSEEQIVAILREVASSGRPAYARALTALWCQHYNTERPHSSLGYLTPSEFAAKWASEHGAVARVDETSEESEAPCRQAAESASGLGDGGGFSPPEDTDPTWTVSSVAGGGGEAGCRARPQAFRGRR